MYHTDKVTIYFQMLFKNILTFFAALLSTIATKLSVGIVSNSAHWTSRKWSLHEGKITVSLFAFSEMERLIMLESDAE